MAGQRKRLAFKTAASSRSGARVRAAAVTLGLCLACTSLVVWPLLQPPWGRAPAAVPAALQTDPSSGSSNASLAAADTVLRSCNSLDCMRSVHELAGTHARFNYPHFMVIGWRKCATTSLYQYLIRQPQVQGPSTKEPHFFTGLCARSPWRCPPELARESFYVRKVLGAAGAGPHPFSRALFEASADYSEEGATVATALRQALPWVRVVASLREPISRAISWQNGLASYAHTHRISCLKRADLFTCLRRYFNGGLRNYSYPLSRWIEEFPREQLFFMLYENMTGSGEAGVLRELHSFLGLDQPPPGVPGLDSINIRKVDRPQGWLLMRRQYRHLMQLVRPDVHRVAELLEQHGLGPGRAWAEVWEAAWHENLNSNCNASGHCHIQLT